MFTRGMSRNEFGRTIWRVGLTLMCLSMASLAHGQAPPSGPEDVASTFDPDGPYDNDAWPKHAVVDQPAQDPPPEGLDPPEGGTPPANDNCGSATVIPGDVVVYNPAVINTTGATNSICEPNESCEAGDVGTSNSVWYSYTPTMSGLVEIHTLGSNYNTVLSVFDGCSLFVIPCSLPTELACQDDDFGPQSVVTLNVIAGENYRIKVSDYNTSDGGGSLNFNLTWFPPNDQCGNAAIIPSVIYDPPTYSTTSAGTEQCEAQESCEVNNSGVSHTVWYSYTAPCDGTISLNTNGSSYDTVLSVWDRCGYWPGVDYPCNYGQPAPVQLSCDDDSGTGLQSQIIDVPVSEGEEYLIKVAAYGTGAAGGTVNFNFMFEGANPPTAIISSPAPFACVCGGSVNVFGTAAAGFDPVSWTLDYQQVGTSGWTTINSGTTLVLGLSLGTWNTTLLPQGNYFLRLTVQNSCGLVSTAVSGAFVDQAFDNLDVRAPQNGAIVAGTACLDGSAWDQCFSNYTVTYRPAGGGAFMPINAAMPVYSTPVLNDPLASGWNTSGVADGDYELRVQGTDICGHVATVTRTIEIDNTPPVAIIDSPLPCAHVEGSLQIIGTAYDANLSGWVLQYTGGDSAGWTTIASGSSPVDGVLGTWNTAGLPACAYTLRLLVGTTAVANCDDPSSIEYLVSVDVGELCPVDLNGDGAEDLLDYAEFQNCFTGP